MIKSFFQILILAAVVMGVQFYYLHEKDREQEKARAELVAQKERIYNCETLTVYTASWCGACQAAKQHLARYRIKYREYVVDLDRSANALLETKANQQKFSIAYPTYELNGKLLRARWSDPHWFAQNNICRAI